MDRASDDELRRRHIDGKEHAAFRAVRHAALASDVGEDQIQLDVHVFERLDHMIDMWCPSLDQFGTIADE